MTTSLFEALMERGVAYHEEDDIQVVRHYWTNLYARGDFYRVYYAIHTEHPWGDIFSTLGEVEQAVNGSDGWNVPERGGL